ncbi:MAG TPA: arsinothricin resistance N-acetyltransferase ArsN1 family B [Luteimonas sp.]|nr:arsinothricin resistance N-acetyltransferase ArsN1 family B [Luteimonas sp.]
MTDSFNIRDARAGDAAPVAAIYNHYIARTIVTFELEAVAAGDMCDRIAAVQDDGLPWLVAADAAGAVLGYAYAARWRPRAAYRRSVESSIYLAPQAVGRGIGRCLYPRLIERLRACGLHVVIGGAALPNPASVALHEALGFAKVAHLREVGHKFGRWIDVGYWQLRLE